jgi:hypothetical protein
MVNQKQRKEISLFYCRTPLQLKVSQKIIASLGLSSSCKVIYHPANSSPKHFYYFKSFESVNKYFIPFKQNSPFVVQELFAWNTLPKKLRKCDFSSIYFASIHSILLSRLVSRNVEAKLNIFDDGLLNINMQHFYNALEDHPIHKAIKKIFLLQTNNEILSRTLMHFTIYDLKLSQWMPCPSRQIDLLESTPFQRKSPQPTKKLRLLIGNTFDHIKNFQPKKHDELAHSSKFDIFIPHPASKLQPRLPNFLNEVINGEMTNNLIAEDIIFELMQHGYKVIIYGFSSSVLLNLSRYSQVVSLLLHESLEINSGNNIELNIAISLRNAGVKVLSDDPTSNFHFSIGHFNKLASNK